MFRFLKKYDPGEKPVAGKILKYSILVVAQSMKLSFKIRKL